MRDTSRKTYGAKFRGSNNFLSVPPASLKLTSPAPHRLLWPNLHNLAIFRRRPLQILVRRASLVFPLNPLNYLSRAALAITSRGHGRALQY